MLAGPPQPPELRSVPPGAAGRPAGPARLDQGGALPLVNIQRGGHAFHRLPARPGVPALLQVAQRAQGNPRGRGELPLGEQPCGQVPLDQPAELIIPVSAGPDRHVMTLQAVVDLVSIMS
jgi:hypothetical protein